MNEERCPRCKSDRVDHHCALGKIKRVCAQCGEEWGNLMGYGAASMRIREEERAKPKPFRGEGPPMVLRIEVPATAASELVDRREPNRMSDVRYEVTIRRLRKAPRKAK